MHEILFRDALLIPTIDGQFFLIFMAQQLPFPNDGIRYQDQEQRYALPAGNNRVRNAQWNFVQELIAGHCLRNSKYWRSSLAISQATTRSRIAFVDGIALPKEVTLNSSSSITRVAKLFVCTSSVLLYGMFSFSYSAIQSSLGNTPVRSYPLRPYNEPAVFVLGDRQGQKVNYPNIGGLAERGQAIPPNVMGMGFGNPQALLAQQNSNMEAIERRNQRERDRSASMSQVNAESAVCTFLRV